MKKLIAPTLIILAVGYILFSAVSCTPQKKLTRLIKKHPELLTLEDTIKIVDTVRFQTERVYRDSVFLVSDARQDTVIIRENQLTIRTYIKGDSIFIDGECDTVFIDKIVKYNVPYPVVKAPHRSIFKELITGFIGIAIAFTLGFILYKLINWFKNRSRFS